MQRRTFLGCLALSLLTGLAGCGPSTKEKHVIQTLTQGMQTHGIGRFLIDLPKGFALSNGAFVTLYYGLDKNFKSVEVSVLETGVNRAKFEAYVKKQAAEIGKERHDELNVSMLAAQVKVSDNSILLRSYRNFSGKDSFKSYLFILVNDLLIQAKEESFDGQFAAAEARLQKLATQLSKPADISKAGRGFCLGPLLIAAAHDEEKASFEFGSSETNTVMWEIYYSAIAPDEDTLLKRVDSKMGMLEKIGVVSKTVRRGAIQMGGMKAEEYLTTVDVYDIDSVLFNAETIRPNPAFARPKIALTLQTGGFTSPNLESAKPPQWSTDEAVGVWDAVVKSVRLRPGAV